MTVITYKTRYPRGERDRVIDDKPMSGGLIGLSKITDPNDEAAASPTGVPLNLKLAVIREDYGQPRTESNPGFSIDSIGELSESIKLRGIKSPISVRINPLKTDKYIINHGARRYRACLRAGLDTIPCFIDNQYNDADQVVENLQRNELTAREIANFIGREISKGISKLDIARSISKSPAFISQYVTLLELPDAVANVFNSGRVVDVTTINELVTALKRNPVEVTHWLESDKQEITRGSVKNFRDFLSSKKKAEKNEYLVATKIIDDLKVVDVSPVNSDVTVVVTKQPDDLHAPQDHPVKLMFETEPIKSLVIEERTYSKRNNHIRQNSTLETSQSYFLRLTYNSSKACLVLSRLPEISGNCWIKLDSDNSELEVPLSAIVLISVSRDEQLA